MADGKGKVSLAGRIKEKLVAKKERDAAEQRHITGRPADSERRRLPPGQRLVEKWPVLDLGIIPNVPKDAFALDVAGEIENPISWTWTDLMAQPQVRMTSDIHCVTSWSRYDNHWEGVSAHHLLSIVRPRPEARHVLFVSHDNYTTNVPFERFNDDDVLLAHSWEGKPLDREHGGPLRIILPKLYLWKSAKWVKRIVFMARDMPGYWEVRGYHNVGDPWEEERYSER
jgi:DMSO/TMAO reductase YedYZ molybdopterin-dependent catalytic subunit